MDIQKLKQRSTIEHYTEQLEKNENVKTAYDKDPTYWQPDVDAAGNGFAQIRFLAAPYVDGEDALPWTRIWGHFFKGPTGKWYVENSLTTLGQDDPASAYNSLLWNTKIKANQEIASKQKRKLNYISNIRVIRDPKNPENEGKIFRFKYGSKIFDKIKFAMKPPFEGDTAFVPYDFWRGADFKLKVTKVEGQRNYDQSEWVKTYEADGTTWKGTPVAETDDQIEAIWKNSYSLLSEVTPDKFKSYDELKKRLDAVIGFDTANPAGISKTSEQPDTREQPSKQDKRDTAVTSAADVKVKSVDDNEKESLFDGI